MKYHFNVMFASRLCQCYVRFKVMPIDKDKLQSQCQIDKDKLPSQCH